MHLRVSGARSGGQSRSLLEVEESVQDEGRKRLERCDHARDGAAVRRQEPIPERARRKLRRQTGSQEHYPGHAEDRYRVVGYLGKNALLTEEWTRLEPGVLDHKLYVRGTGTVLERTVRGGDELNELVAVRKR